MRVDYQLKFIDADLTIFKLLKDWEAVNNKIHINLVGAIDDATLCFAEQMNGVEDEVSISKSKRISRSSQENFQQMLNLQLLIKHISYREDKLRHQER